MITWLIDMWNVWRHPPPQWDSDFLDSDFEFCMDCPDTMPTKPGALDGL